MAPIFGGLRCSGFGTWLCGYGLAAETKEATSQVDRFDVADHWTCGMALEEDPAEVAADEATAAKHSVFEILGAAEEGDLPAVRGFVRRKPKNVDEIGDCGGTALHEAAVRGHVAVAEFLVSRNADVNIQNVWSSTPLHIATYHGHVDYIKVLLAANAKTSLKDRDGKTALDRAREKGKTEIVNLLSGTKA
jgi:ankyrin repeat protein